MADKEKAKPNRVPLYRPWDNPDSYLYRVLRATRRGVKGERSAHLDPPLNINLKKAFYLLSGPAHATIGFIYKNLRAPRSGKEIIKVQLGPGKKNYFKGWINLEGNILSGKCDLWVNLNNALPFNDNTVDVIYSHHVVEHLQDMDFHFREMYRVLKPGGCFRVGGPNGDTALRKFAEGDASWFYDFPEKRRSLGGKFNNWLFCGHEHLSILTFSYLEEIATNAGFSNIRRCLPHVETRFPEFIDETVFSTEGTDPIPQDPYHLIVEGQKNKS
jgi:SAM-dependent methyltransferase